LEEEKEKEGDGKFQEWGAICCAQCEQIIAFYPPEADIFGDDELELYCQDCTLALQKGEH